MWISKDEFLLEGGAYLRPGAYQRKCGIFTKLFIMLGIILIFYNVKQFMDNSEQPYRCIPNVFYKKEE